MTRISNVDQVLVLLRQQLQRLLLDVDEAGAKLRPVDGPACWLASRCCHAASPISCSCIRANAARWLATSPAG